MLTRIVGIAFAIVFASAAHAEWKLIAEASSTAPGMSYDPARVRYEAPYITAWTRVVLAKPGTLGSDVEYLSAVQKVVFDCGSRSWAVAQSEFFANFDSSGLPVYSYNRPREQWDLRKVRRSPNAERLMRVVCSTPKPW